MKRFIPHLYLIAANLIYGINYSVAKWVMPEHIKAFGFVLFRCISAVLFFWILHLFIPKVKIKIAKKDILRFLGCAFFGVCFNQLAFFQGLDYTTPISGAIIMTSTPIWVLILSFLILKYPITWRKAFGVILGLIGAILLISYGNSSFSKSAPNPGLGNILILLNAASYSTYLVLAKPLLEKYNQIFILKWIFLLGMIMVLPFGISQAAEVDWYSFDFKAIIGFIFVMLFVSCLAYLFNLSALKR